MIIFTLYAAASIGPGIAWIDIKADLGVAECQWYVDGLTDPDEPQAALAVCQRERKV